MAARVQYTYCHSYCVLHRYSDRGGVGEREWQFLYSTRTATVTVSYTDTLTEVVGEREWQYVYSTSTATVTVSYTDTLTEGGRGERVAVRVQYTYCHSYCV